VSSRTGYPATPYAPSVCRAGRYVAAPAVTIHLGDFSSRQPETSAAGAGVAPVTLVHGVQEVVTIRPSVFETDGHAARDEEE
jgi:hypothetical protein